MAISTFDRRAKRGRGARAGSSTANFLQFEKTGEPIRRGGNKLAGEYPDPDHRMDVEDQDFEQMVMLHYPRIRRAALLLSNGNDSDADDLTQETLLQAARGWSRFKRESATGTWLYAILLNRHRQSQRLSHRLWRRWRSWFEKSSKNADSSAPDSRLVAEEWRTSLWSAVAMLPEPQREAVVLRYSEGLSYEEVAEVLKCPVGTVKSRLHHALGTLQRELTGRELTQPKST